MIRPCDLPQNSKIRWIGSVEPVRSVTVKSTLTVAPSIELGSSQTENIRMELLKTFN